MILQSQRQYENPDTDVRVWVDAKLQGVRGAFTAVAWTEAELEENPCRRGKIRLPVFPGEEAKSDTDWALKLRSQSG